MRQTSTKITMSMNDLIGIGNDIIEIERIAQSIEEFGDKFLERLFTKKEQDYCNGHVTPTLRFAGRFAAKEAIAKALGVGFGERLKWLDIEILNNAEGKPIVTLPKHFMARVELSISHCHSYATAAAIAVRTDGPPVSPPIN